ncbi:unnamed protein product, partial [Protopolystoma xenopodis]
MSTRMRQLCAIFEPPFYQHEHNLQYDSYISSKIEQNSQYVPLNFAISHHRSPINFDACKNSDQVSNLAFSQHPFQNISTVHYPIPLEPDEKNYCCPTTFQLPVIDNVHKTGSPRLNSTKLCTSGPKLGTLPMSSPLKKIMKSKKERVFHPDANCNASCAISWSPLLRRDFELDSHLQKLDELHQIAPQCPKRCFKTHMGGVDSNSILPNSVDPYMSSYMQKMDCTMSAMTGSLKERQLQSKTLTSDPLQEEKSLLSRLGSVLDEPVPVCSFTGVACFLPQSAFAQGARFQKSYSDEEDRYVAEEEEFYGEKQNTSVACVLPQPLFSHGARLQGSYQNEEARHVAEEEEFYGENGNALEKWRKWNHFLGYP